MRPATCVVLLAWLLVGCSGSGGGSPASSAPTSPPTTKVRFVNAAPNLGTLTFILGMQQAAVASRDASPAIDVPAGSTNVTVTAASTSTMRALPLAASSQLDIVAYEAPVGVLNIDVIAGGVASVDGTKSLVTLFGKGSPSALDAYLVAPGVSLGSVGPTIPGADGSAMLAPGAYVLVLTPQGDKTVVYRSGTFNLGAGQQALFFVVADAHGAIVPYSLTFDGAPVPAPDPRPTIKVLKRIDPISNNGPSSIKMDGLLLLQTSSAMDVSDFAYHLDPGNHLFEDGQYFSGFQVAPSTLYLQTFGAWEQGIAVGYDWLTPIAAPDYPAPSGKARVRLLVNDNCGGTEVIAQIDGSSVAYPNQNNPLNPGLVIDRDPGPIHVSVGGNAGTVVLGAGHYYVIRVFNFGIVIQCQPALHSFEASSD